MHQHSDAAASKLGRLGMGLSLACAVHCMAMPLLLAVLPLAGLGFLLDHRIETGVVLASLALATWSLNWGYRQHRRQWIVWPFLLAAGLLIAGRCLPDCSRGEVALMVSGALILAAVQFTNHRLCHACPACVREEHEEHEEVEAECR